MFSSNYVASASELLENIERYISKPFVDEKVIIVSDWSKQCIRKCNRRSFRL